MVTVSNRKGLTRFAPSFVFIVIVFLWICPKAPAQTGTAFTPEEKFNIPEYGGAIGFAVDGSYATATLKNGTWEFTDLRLNGSQPLENLKVSAQSSKVTILLFRTSNTTYWSARLRYVAEGQGKQIINLGIDSENGEWNVIVNGVFLAEGEGWQISPDETLTVTGATGNVTIVCYDFLGSMGRSTSSLPFYEQHSVALATGGAVAALVVMSVAITVRNKKKLE